MTIPEELSREAPPVMTARHESYLGGFVQEVLIDEREGHQVVTEILAIVRGLASDDYALLDTRTHVAVSIAEVEAEVSELGYVSSASMDSVEWMLDDIRRRMKGWLSQPSSFGPRKPLEVKKPKHETPAGSSKKESNT